MAIRNRLDLMDLQSGRWDRVGQAVGQMGRAFGDAPLTLQNLQRSEEDRALKLEGAARTRRLDDEHAADRKKKALDEAVATRAAAGVAAGKPMAQVVQESFDDPALQELGDQAAVEAAYGKARLDKDKTDADIGNRRSLAEDRKVRQALAERLANLRERGLISDEAYRKEMVGLGWSRLRQQDEHHDENVGLGRDRLDFAKERARAGQAAAEKREARLAGKDISPKEREELANYEDVLNRLDDLQDFQTAAQVETGPIAGIVSLIRRKVHMQGADDATLRAATAQIVNQVISDFAGRAVTAQELARVMETVPSMFDEEAIWNVLVQTMREKIVSKHNAKVDILSRTPGRAWTKNAFPNRGPDGKPITPPVEQPAAPAAPGGVIMEYKGKRKLVPADKVEEAKRRGAVEVK